MKVIYETIEDAIKRAIWNATENSSRRIERIELSPKEANELMRPSGRGPWYSYAEPTRYYTVEDAGKHIGAYEGIHLAIEPKRGA